MTSLLIRPSLFLLSSLLTRFKVASLGCVMFLSLSITINLMTNYRFSGTDSPAYIAIFNSTESIWGRVQHRLELVFYGLAYLLRIKSIPPEDILLLLKLGYLLILILSVVIVAGDDSVILGGLLVATVVSSHVFILQLVNKIRFGFANSLALFAMVAIIRGRALIAFAVFVAAALSHLSFWIIVASYAASFGLGFLGGTIFSVVALALGVSAFPRDLLFLHYALFPGANLQILLFALFSIFLLLLVSAYQVRHHSLMRLLRLSGLTFVVAMLMIPSEEGVGRRLYAIFFQLMLAGSIALSLIKERRLMLLVSEFALTLMSVFVRFHSSRQRNLQLLDLIKLRMEGSNLIIDLVSKWIKYTLIGRRECLFMTGSN